MIHEILKKLDQYDKKEMKKFIKIFNITPKIFNTKIKAEQTIENLNLQFTKEQLQKEFVTMNSAAMQRFDLKYQYPIEKMSKWSLEEALIKYKGFNFKRIYYTKNNIFDNYTLSKKPENEKILNDARLIQEVL